MSEAPPSGGLLFCEFEIPRGGHAEVNAALIRTARCAHPDEPIRLLAEREHLAAVDRLLRANGVEDVALEESPLASDAQLTILREELIFGALVRRSRREAVRRVVFCSCSRRRVGWAKLVARKLPDVEVVVVLHETDYTVGFAQGNVLERFFHRLYYGSLPANLTLLVLGPWIAAEALAHYPFVRGALAWMWHPYDYPLGTPEGGLAARSLEAPIVFAFFGVAKEMKGAADFQRLAHRLSDEYGPERVRFLHLGRQAPNALPLGEGDGIESPAAGGELTRSEIAELAGAVDYAVFPYRADAYRGRSSGALHDALAYGTPILAYRGPLFESYFDELGDLGDMVATYEELERLVRSLIEAPPVDRYRTQRVALRQATERLSCAALAEQFREPTKAR